MVRCAKGGCRNLCNHPLTLGWLVLSLFQCYPNLLFNLGSQSRVLFQEDFGCIPTLCKFAIVVGVPRAALLDYAIVNTEVEDFANLLDTLAIHNVEFSLTERRRNLVLNNFNFGAGAELLVAILNH